MSDSAGMTRPNRYTNLSDVMTALKQENHEITVTSIAAEAAPYTMDSSVRGLPLGRYVRIVAPSWLNAGLNSAAKISIGSIYARLNRSALLPFKYTEYENAQMSDETRQYGLVNTIEKAMTSAKYVKFTIG
jgi:hypothetical protein